MTRDEAIKALKECGVCKRWRVAPSCDHCWVDRHRCPPTLEQATTTLRRAVTVGQEAEVMLARLKRTLAAELKAVGS